MTTGILLLNLGTPDSLAVEDVRRYLREFLMDEHVLAMPYWKRWLVVNGAILPTRPKESAHAYSRIWTKEGSPLLVISRGVRDEIARRVPHPVELAMRYGNPAPEPALEALAKAGATEVVGVPLYPHYAASSWLTGVQRVEAARATVAPEMKLRWIKPFHSDPLYLDAMVRLIRPHLHDFDQLLFSFHGIPESHLRTADPTGTHCLSSPDCCDRESAAFATCYRAHAFATVRGVVSRLGLNETQYGLSFQSRLGKEPWIKPYTDVVLEELPKRGVKRLLIISPAFLADCLETIEELGMRGSETFLGAGGEDYRLIPCLNTEPYWMDALAEMIG